MFVLNQEIVNSGVCKKICTDSEIQVDDGDDF